MDIGNVLYTLMWLGVAYVAGGLTGPWVWSKLRGKVGI